MSTFRFCTSHQLAHTTNKANRFNIYATRKRSIDTMPIQKLNVLNVHKKADFFFIKLKRSGNSTMQFRIQWLELLVFENSDCPHEGKYQMGVCTNITAHETHRKLRKLKYTRLIGCESFGLCFVPSFKWN